MVSEPEFRRRRTMRVAWLIQRVHENHAARALGSSDGGIISIGAIMDNPTGPAGHLPVHRGGKAVGVAPPVRWGTAIEASFLLGPGEEDRLRWWGTSPCTFKQKRCHNR